MDVGESPPGIAPLAVESAAAPAEPAATPRAEGEGRLKQPVAGSAHHGVHGLPFPENFVGTFNDDGSVRVATERLAFEVRPIETQDDLFKAIVLRHDAYARHLPELARRLTVPESADTAPGHTVLLAENRLDRSALATVRLQTNEHGPLALEGSIDLPAWLQGRKLAEATRLAVSEKVRGRFVTLVMFKAFFQFCLGEEVEWMVVGARPPLDRVYRSLGFEDVIPGGGFVSLQHTAGIAHRVLAFNVARAEPLWRTSGHPLYAFMGLTVHPDIRVGRPGPSAVPNTPYYRDRAAVL